MPNKKKERLSGIVRLRGGFSDTSGIAPRNTTIQLDDFNKNTRARICNALLKKLQPELDCIEISFNEYDSPSAIFCMDILDNLFCKSYALTKNQSFAWRDVFSQIEEAITKCVFNEVLDVVEYCCDWISKHVTGEKKKVYKDFNKLFEQEYVGYRFIKGKIVAISNQIEIETIEKACNNPYEGCRAHIQKALGFLADPQKKDYKNSIKESISAVESICVIITNVKKATLSDALKKLEQSGLELHSALKIALDKLFSYTSNKGGIRHAEGLFESHVDFEEAEFMLASCSAFVNYLIAQHGKRGV